MSPRPPPVTALWLVRCAGLAFAVPRPARVFGCEGATVVLGGWLGDYRLAVLVIRLLK